ncbi:hypothetical protein CVT24_001042 [Panaeolus cyanescens]|uniref:Uncharacterized protein n=1 Tax=Panaeolus cyanescens TaxID=181874 RepID=A0A409VX32_9AGAR|nr:hypothetical protein CVT24_001042 [Panaeolus cyanescens]
MLITTGYAIKFTEAFPWVYKQKGLTRDDFVSTKCPVNIREEETPSADDSEVDDPGSEDPRYRASDLTYLITEDLEDAGLGGFGPPVLFEHPRTKEMVIIIPLYEKELDRVAVIQRRHFMDETPWDLMKKKKLIERSGLDDKQFDWVTAFIPFHRKPPAVVVNFGWACERPNFKPTTITLSFGDANGTIKVDEEYKVPYMLDAGQGVKLWDLKPVTYLPTYRGIKFYITQQLIAPQPVYFKLDMTRDDSAERKDLGYLRLDPIYHKVNDDQTISVVIDLTAEMSYKGSFVRLTATEAYELCYEEVLRGERGELCNVTTKRFYPFKKDSNSEVAVGA